MRILIVDDEPNIRKSLEGLLRDEGHSASSCSSGEEALERAGKETFDAVLLDVMLPGMGGLDVLERIQPLIPEAGILMMSGQADIVTAVKAVQTGARQFLEKPVDPDRLLIELRNLESQKALEAKVASLETLVESENEMIGESEVMVRLKQDIAKAGPSEGRVLIFGENGTGKELVARAVHGRSRRKDRPFVSLNCAALPQALVESELFGYEKGAFTGAVSRKSGLFETAQGGSLFLDEIGDMAADTQAKLLRVLQENEAVRVGGTAPYRFDVRVIAATNKNLAQEIAAGRFREDLYYRLNVLPLHVPPLRTRGEDVVLLANVFLERICRKTGKGIMRWDAGAPERMRRYAWPGNVRELRNFVERLVIMGEGKVITPEEVVRALPAVQDSAPSAAPSVSPDQNLSLRENLERVEKEILRLGFEETGGNVSLLSRKLKIDRANLHRKLKAYGIK
jgi:two-component system, NtrC family, nitrogen regulation response regulator NtrX